MGRVKTMNLDTPTFLRTCLQSSWYAPALADAETLAQQPGWDWAAVTAAATRARVAPLLFHALQDVPWVPDMVRPGLVWQELERQYVFTAARAVWLQRDLAELLAALTEAGIPHIVLKGAVLGQALYDNVALRPFGDLDVLVHAADIDGAKAVAEGLGYATVGTPMHRDRGPEFLLKEIHLHKNGSAREANLDLHWHLFKPPVMSPAQTPDWFWETAVPAHIRETPTQMLGPEAQVVYLSTHVGEQHAEGLALGSLHTLLWLNDIAMVIARHADEIDWTEVLTRTNSYGLMAPVRAVLLHLAHQWAVPIPASMVGALAEPAAATAKDRTLELLTADTPVNGPVHRGFFVTMAGLPSWPSRVRFALHAGVPSWAYMQKRYKVRRPVLTPLFYVYRGLVGVRSLAVTVWLYLRQRWARPQRHTP